MFDGSIVMRKLFVVAASLFIFGGCVEANVVDDLGKNSAKPQLTDEDSSIHRVDAAENAELETFDKDLCGLFASRDVTVQIDGTAVSLPVFVMCNPNYVDLGYPLPLQRGNVDE